MVVDLIITLIGTLLGLIVGLLSGFFFERRATNAARKHSEELERELADLRHSVLSMGGAISTAKSLHAPAEDLVEDVRKRGVAIQDPDGRVFRAGLISYFVAKGHSTSEVDFAIKRLCSSGEVRDARKWLEFL